MRTIYPFFLAFLLSACNSAGTNTSREDSVAFTSDNIPLERNNINPQPVKMYAETIRSFETTDEFKVGLYETQQTFRYLIKISYKQMEVEDTLRVPNFGILPAVDIVKGDSIHPSCIVGFLDKEKKFRESKLIAFANNKLKVKVLKHYAVYQSE
ncbi:hypothetical protein [Parafilimonas terrae]|uniref:Lipoprotein n=1 Tax=Parafilimonas terrae TaxID=1465490 RepID=A0A1I5RDS6_9BACT|nr:hypothetical protein [Parafilimonas terrae]SFP56497.1 hypothetical protein SAMN05444277_101196 [Parafilimonas terrae]